MNKNVLAKLRCPLTHSALREEAGHLVTIDGLHRYDVTASGIPLFSATPQSTDAASQLEHYQRIAEKYVENLAYPHTQEYTSYLDRVLIRHIRKSDLAESAELCCGQGELLPLVGSLLGMGVGVDISPAMLEAARRKHFTVKSFAFVQGDATHLPLADGSFTSVFMLGGIHHVSDRTQLFSEVFRVLKPGGRFYFREPLSDFFLWRWIRAVIYRVSPTLDADTERPLLWNETVPVLKSAGFDVKVWESCGFFGFCLFMNSDVLIFNRLFRFIPGIRFITRLWTHIDAMTLKIPFLSRSGLQVIGVAEKPPEVGS